MFLPQDDAQYRRPETEGKSRYSTAIKAMKEYLEEESIDKIMCWGEADEAQDELPSLLAEFEREFGKNGLFGQTGTRGHRLEVTRDYALRIGLQKLLHAAHLIDKRVASSNLWVAAKVDNRGRPSFLRSEEREGYFSVRQLVEPSPSGMRLRALEVSYEPSAADQQSAAAECLVKRSVCIQRIAGTHFPSEEEQRRKITHIVGIPAKPARTGKGPVSITVDLSCQSGLTSAEEGEIVARADGVAKLLGRLARWAAKGQPSLPLRGR
jgi:hypothetical protein